MLTGHRENCMQMDSKERGDTCNRAVSLLRLYVPLSRWTHQVRLHEEFPAAALASRGTWWDRAGHVHKADSAQYEMGFS